MEGNNKCKSGSLWNRKAIRGKTIGEKINKTELVIWKDQLNS